MRGGIGPGRGTDGVQAGALAGATIAISVAPRKQLPPAVDAQGVESLGHSGTTQPQNGTRTQHREVPRELVRLGHQTMLAGHAVQLRMLEGKGGAQAVGWYWCKFDALQGQGARQMSIRLDADAHQMPMHIRCRCTSDAPG